jgi:MFS family permease
MSGIISAPQFFRVFPDLDPINVGASQSSTMQAFYTAIYELGCLAGAIFALFFGNKIGRRRNILIGGTFVIIGTIIQITSMPGHVIFLQHTRNVLTPSCSHLAGHQFVIGRIVTGFGNGLNTATVPSW